MIRIHISITYSYNLKPKLFRKRNFFMMRTENRTNGKGEKMSDRDEIIACYEAMYDGEIRKDIEYLRQYLDESYVLVHMTGVRMTRQEYFDAVMDGTLNYYWCEHEHEPVTITGNTAKMRGDTKVEAAVYGGGKHVWRLRLDCDFVKKEGVWKMTKSVASTY